MQSDRQADVFLPEEDKCKHHYYHSGRSIIRFKIWDETRYAVHLCLQGWGHGGENKWDVVRNYFSLGLIEKSKAQEYVQFFTTGEIDQMDMEAEE